MVEAGGRRQGRQQDKAKVRGRRPIAFTLEVLRRLDARFFQEDVATSLEDHPHTDGAVLAAFGHNLNRGREIPVAVICLFGIDKLCRLKRAVAREESDLQALIFEEPLVACHVERHVLAANDPVELNRHLLGRGALGAGGNKGCSDDEWEAHSAKSDSHELLLSLL